jgi:hypothetical protein
MRLLKTQNNAVQAATLAPMNLFFKKLGQTVVERWQSRNFSPEAFPEIAKRALEAHPPSDHINTDAFIREFLFDEEQPFQTQSGFGQPEIVVFDHPRFYIQLLFWLDGTTDIHQHMFSGAFHVLEGSSLHSRYEFRDAESISTHLRVGVVHLSETQLLEKGRTVEIVSGSGFIHSLFHLDTPSVTVVVRTHHDPGSGPQFTYLPPHLAVDPLHNDALTNRRKQLLDLLETANDPEYPEIVSKMVAELDFERGFFILQNCFKQLHEFDSWDAVWSVFERKHGRLAPFVHPTIEEIVRRDALVTLRSIISNVEHRFFLALMLTVPDRREFLRLISERVKGKPERAITRWINEITDSTDDTEWVWEAHRPLLWAE